MRHRLIILRMITILVMIMMMERTEANRMMTIAAIFDEGGNKQHEIAFTHAVEMINKNRWISLPRISCGVNSKHFNDKRSKDQISWKFSLEGMLPQCAWYFAIFYFINSQGMLNEKLESWVHVMIAIRNPRLFFCIFEACFLEQKRHFLASCQVNLGGEILAKG